MDFHALSKHSSVEKLKCTKCQNFLSYFPISVSPNNTNFCGRCAQPSIEENFQNVAFETLSQFLRFPCRYNDKGCTEELQPKKIPDHEEKCLFRIIPCPVKSDTGCGWGGSRVDLLKHCRDNHNGLFLKNFEFVMDLTVKNNNRNLIDHENILLIFEKNFDCDEKILKFGLYTHEYELNFRKFNAQLKATCGNKNLSVDFVTSVYKDKDLSELNLESIKTTSVKAASFKIHIGEEIEDPDRIINLEMLSVLKCFTCLEYAVPPIYHCVNNSETLCSACKDTHQSSCPQCQNNITSTRNINLDKIANMLNYPCKNQKNACFFISKPDKMKQHEQTCELGDFSCPIKDFEDCNWKGLLSNLEQHIQNNHQELVSNSTQISKQLAPQKMKCDIIKFSNQLFRLVCMKTSEEKYMWNVQIIGPCDDDFKYEIEILDPGSKGRRLLVRQQCGRLTNKDKIFQNGGSFSYFLKDQIRDFVVDQVVSFKVHIFV